MMFLYIGSEKKQLDDNANNCPLIFLTFCVMVYSIYVYLCLLSDRLPPQQPASTDCRASPDASNDHEACDLRHGNASYSNDDS